MDIAIIGAGNVGRALTQSAKLARHNVTISSKAPEHARQLAEQLGARAAASNLEAVEAAEAVVLAVPADAVPGIIEELGSALDGKVLIDPTNRNEPAQLDGASNAENIQAQAPSARVVKAFNTILASHQDNPTVNGLILDAFVAADDDDAKAKVLDLVKGLGFRPIDSGPLAMARALEAMAVLNIALNLRNGWSWQSGWKLVGAPGGV